MKCSKARYAGIYLFISVLSVSLHERKTVLWLVPLVEFFVKLLLLSVLYVTKHTHTPLMYCYLSTRYCSSTLHVLTQSSRTSCKMGATIPPIFRWRNQGTERFTKLPEVMRPVSVRAGLWTLTNVFPELCSELPHPVQSDPLGSVIIIYYCHSLPMVRPEPTEVRASPSGHAVENLRSPQAARDPISRPTCCTLCTSFAARIHPLTQFPSSSLDRWRNWGLEHLKDCVKVAELVIDKVI